MCKHPFRCLVQAGPAFIIHSQRVHQLIALHRFQDSCKDLSAVLCQKVLERTEITDPLIKKEELIRIQDFSHIHCLKAGPVTVTDSSDSLSHRAHSAAKLVCTCFPALHNPAFCDTISHMMAEHFLGFPHQKQQMPFRKRDLTALLYRNAAAQIFGKSLA